MGVTQRWSSSIEGYSDSSPAVVNGALYVGSGGTDSESGTVAAFSAADGSELWQVETDVPMYSSPAVDDDTVYLGAQRGGIYALHEP